MEIPQSDIDECGLNGKIPKCALAITLYHYPLNYDQDKHSPIISKDDSYSILVTQELIPLSSGSTFKTVIEPFEYKYFKVRVNNYDAYLTVYMMV